MEYTFEEGIAEFKIPLITKALEGNQFESEQLGTGRYFYGMASLPNIDTQGDKIELKAIEDGAKNLTKAPYNKIFLGHNYQDIAIGIILKTQMIDKGLMILAKLNDNHERADEVWKSINEGFLDGLSIGGSFIKVKPEYNEELQKYVNVVKKVVFREVSLTSIPANPEALTIGAFTKSLEAIKQFKEKSESFKYSVNISKSMEDNSTPQETETTTEEVIETETPVQETPAEEVKVDEETTETPNETANETATETAETENSNSETNIEEAEPISSTEATSETPVEDTSKVEPEEPKVDTTLIDALRKQIEEQKQLINQLQEKVDNITKKSVRQSVKSFSTPKKVNDGNILLGALRG